MQIIKLRFSFFILFSFVFCLGLSGQSVREYFDADWERTDEEHASFYRVISYGDDGKPVGKVRDYWVTGELQFEGRFLSVSPDTLDGVCVWYYRGGGKEREVEYERGVIVGAVRNWSELGKEEGVLDESGRFYSDKYLILKINGLDDAMKEDIKIDSSTVFLLLGMGALMLNDRAFEYLPLFFKLAHDVSILLEDQPSQAMSYFNIGGVYLISGDTEEALKFFIKGKKIQEHLNLDADIALTYNSIGVVYSTQGHMEMALDWHHKARIIQRELNLELALATTYNHIGFVFQEMGLLNEALKWFNRAKAVREQMKPNTELAISYNNIGFIYRRRNKKEQALHWFNKARYVFESVGNETYLPPLYNNIGTIYIDKKQYDEALTWYTKAKNIQERLGLNVDLANSHHGIGNVYSFKGEWQEALNWYDKAINILERLDLEVNLSTYYNSVGNIYETQGMLEEALKWYLKAKDIQERLGLDVKLVKTYENLGHLFFSISQYKNSLDCAKKIIGLNENIRYLNKGELDRRLYIKKSLDAIEFGMLSAYECDEIITGFNFSEVSKARGLSDLLIERPNKDIQLLLATNSSYKQLHSQFLRLNIGLNQEMSRIKRKYLIKLRDSVFHNMQELKDQIGNSSLGYGNAIYPRSIQEKQIESVLYKDEVLVSFFVGQNITLAFILRNSGLEMIYLGGSNYLKLLVESFREEYIKNQRRNHMRNDHRTQKKINQLFFQQSHQLYKKLWAPLEKTGLLKNKKIILIPDGFLNYLPFELLVKDSTQQKYSDYNYLIKDYPINYYPSATVLHFERTKKPKTKNWTKDFFGLAQSDFSNNFCYEDSRVFGKLTYSVPEVTAISQHFSANRSSTLINESASESTFKSMFLSNYRYLHFSTHGLINTEQPDFSRVLLKPSDKDDGCLNIYEIFELKLNADLVTLSACETGLGKLVKGEGMVGFTRALMYAGTPSVILSLWEVGDASTKDLFINYYTTLSKKGNDKYSPLRASQLRMIEEGDEQANPYYWAPFIFIGERYSKF